MLNLKKLFTLNKLLATFGLLILGGLSLFVGIANIDIYNLISGDPQSQTILFSSRLPRLLAICLAGAGLSVAGLIMQQVCQNRFASPSTTGTIDCAMLGYIVSLVFLSGASQWLNLSVIFAFSVAGTLIFVRFLQTLKFKNTMLVPLIGIMYGNVISALATFIAYRFDLVQTMSAWTVANFSSVLQGNYEFLYLALPACIIAYYYASQFSAASVGESFAKNIGLDYTKIVLIGVIIVAMLASAVVMIVGVIPFLGLIVPNLVALFMGDNMRRNLPWVAYWGIIMVLVCDVIGRVIIFPYEMPISMIISVFGGAVFIMLVLKDKSNA
ncbi:iron(III) ABC transporter permease [Psychromonas marina]|uniref:Iron(III) ABC transporter permease n=1 Tax=Psychromonas marina TaxID=88364 RepID=A0ABQ6DZ10_9GAMM|nr:iron chelate uptake ABC transporter family permease subunit [Psychromonas marina]GLS90396.1 iron(III) ABC transporter permease [Psychromonas marina]